jgi:hypothetical protein
VEHPVDLHRAATQSVWVLAACATPGYQPVPQSVQHQKLSISRLLVIASRPAEVDLRDLGYVLDDLSCLDHTVTEDARINQ